MRLWRAWPSTAKEKRPRQWKTLRRVCRFAFGGGTLRACSEALGFAFLAMAGWMAHPIAAAVIAALYFLNLAYSPRSKP